MPTPVLEPAQTDQELDAPLTRLPVPPAHQAPADSGKKSERIANAIVLTILFATPALMCLHAAAANDPDIWWHLRTGQWILQHRAIPHTDPFSWTNAGKPWPAYSWLYELLVIKIFQRFGLAGIVGYSTVMVLAITVALWRLVHRLQEDFTIVVGVTFAACYSLGHMYTPRPWLFTILFFVLEVDILMHARKTGRMHGLAWLPLIFAVWSNIHIQFIDGLIVLGLALAEPIAARWNIGEKTGMRLGPMAAALAGSFVATFLNPFGWHIYRIAYQLASQSGVLNKINELSAIPFRDSGDFCVLFLALGSAAALAWGRRVRVFEVGLLLFAACVSFRSQRDVWVMATAAAAILASSITGTQRTSVRLPRFAPAIAVVVAFGLILAGFPILRVNNQRLETKIAETLPVGAVNDIRTHAYAGPLYNDFNWGGYLIWALRMPVSVDGRAAFYGDKALDQSYLSWYGYPAWKADQDLAAANLIVGPVNSPLLEILSHRAEYQMVYKDATAAVFVRCR